MSMVRFGLGCLALVLIMTVFLPWLWQSMTGALPLLVVFGFWWARPMSWESEFEHALKRLGKAR